MHDVREGLTLHGLQVLCCGSSCSVHSAKVEIRAILTCGGLL